MKKILILVAASFIINSCQKELEAPADAPATIPVLTTKAATSVTAATAASGGNISSDGGAAVTARGVCWSTTANPDITASHTTDGNGIGTFTSAIAGLTASTKYYIRAYATNNVGTAYGNQESFTTTTSSTALATVTTTAASAITTTTASGGGNVTADGGAAITARGICWSTAANPDITGNHTSDGTGNGIFTSAMAGLTAATTYHVRAYATNSVGTSYGGDSTFTTATVATVPSITTAAVTAITSTTGSGGGNITSDGGATVTARGVCWSTSVSPVVTGSHTTDGTGTGSFTSAITGLTASTKYYVRAYATNSVGTAYGNQESFTTSTAGGNVYIVGYENNGTKDVAKLWKDGVATSLTNGTQNAYAYSVAVLGSDVYIAGVENNGTHDVAKLWKNGVATSLTNGANDAEADAVYVSGSDVWVAGYESNGTKDIVKVWKNGVATTISDGTNDATVYSMFVSGSDIYLAGTEYDASNFPYPTLWKNSITTHLAQTAVFGGYGAGVTVSGTDVYVSGRVGDTPPRATLWTNNVASQLPGGADGSEGLCIFKSGSDIYVGGYVYDSPINTGTIWKNGVAISSLHNGPLDSYVESIYVSGSDIYAIGGSNNGTVGVASYWKNGVVTSLTNGTFDAYAYGFVVK